MADLRVTRVENLSAGGGMYRLEFDGAQPIFATLFAQFENGGGLFMSDRLRRGEHRLAGQWFMVGADGAVMERSKRHASFKLGGNENAKEQRGGA